MYKYLERNETVCEYLYLLLLTFKCSLPLQIGKCTPSRSCIPGWEPLP